MGYRDEREAVYRHAESLEAQLAHAKAASEADEREIDGLRAQLDAAQREIVRLGASAVPARGDSQRKKPYDIGHSQRKKPYGIALLVAAALAGVTVGGGGTSESSGIALSYPTAAALGFGVGGLIGLHRVPARARLGAGLGAVAMVAMLAAFYAAFWSSL